MAAAKKRSKKAPAKKAATNTEETKAQKFSRLGSMRTTKAINAMRALQKLSNRNNYEFTQEQSDKIVSALKKELESVHRAFNTTGGAVREEFSV